jgi:glutaminyl-peptide cyclotransferase
MKRSYLALPIHVLALILAMSGCTNNTQPDDNNPQPPNVPVVNATVIESFPHDTSSFTQGLVVYNGYLYEGTGNLGHSRLYKYSMTSLKNPKPERTVILDSIYFGEGVTVLHDTVYQLTWKNNAVFSYAAKDLRKLKMFSIPTDGWGITTDGKELIVSDGTEYIYFYDPNFNLHRKVYVTESGRLINQINELEYIDGYVYANQWQTQYILKIDPSSGQVINKIDLSLIWEEIKRKDPDADVPNGIAYDPSTKKIYITGKLWPQLFEVKW